MTRYWDEDSNSYIEVEVLWDGTGPSPMELRGRAGWKQREAPIIGKQGKSEYVTARDIRGKANTDRPFGQRYKQLHRPAKMERCQLCNAWEKASTLTERLRLCPRCKGKGRRRSVMERESAA